MYMHILLQNKKHSATESLSPPFSWFWMWCPYHRHGFMQGIRRACRLRKTCISPCQFFWYQSASKQLSTLLRQWEESLSPPLDLLLLFALLSLVFSIRPALFVLLSFLSPARSVPCPFFSLARFFTCSRALPSFAPAPDSIVVHSFRLQIARLDYITKPQTHQRNNIHCLDMQSIPA